MRKFGLLAILLAVSLACSTAYQPVPTLSPAPPTPVPTEILADPTQTASISTVTALRALHVRDVPNGLVIGWLLNGEAVTRLGSCNRDGWVKVQTADGLTGWVNADYLERGCQ